MNESYKYQEYIELLKANKNLILTGAPGTGKTFLAREIAKAMNAEYTLVQFHPSYDYTDFVEGLRPTPPDNNGHIGFERKDGVFKEFCKKAISTNNENGTVSTLDKEIKYTNNIRTFSFYELYKELKQKIENGKVTLYTVYPRSKMDVQILGNDIMYNKGGSYTSNYINDDYVQKIFNYYHDRNIYDITKVPFKDFCDIIGNTLNYTYYRGIVQELLNMSKVKPQNKENPSLNIIQHKDILPPIEKNNKTTYIQNIYNEYNNYLFIIDEINRGELSKIFGELFFCIDPGYRGKKGLVKTQYQNLITDESDPFYEGFYVPENVYIIGTMNDIDRSVESIDFAMRRRFAWKEVKANENTSMLDELGELKNEVIRKMNRLNTAIWNEETNEGIEGLSAAYHIGGAYFMKLKLYLEGDNKTEAYRKLWENHLRGVLFEYLRGSLNATENLSMLEKTFYSENE